MCPDLPRLHDAIIDRLLRHPPDIERVPNGNEPRPRRLFDERPHVTRCLIVPQRFLTIAAKLAIEFNKIAEIELRTIGPDTRFVSTKHLNSPANGSKVCTSALARPMIAGLGSLFTPEFLCALADLTAKQ